MGQVVTLVDNEPPNSDLQVVFIIPGSSTNMRTMVLKKGIEYHLKNCHRV